MSRRQRRATASRRDHSPTVDAVPVSDAARYIALALVGGMIVVIVLLVTQQSAFAGQIGLGYLIAVLALAHKYGFDAYRGVALAPWQESLARLPLRLAGFGVRPPNTLAAAKGSSRARVGLIFSALLSVAVVLGLGVVLFG